MDLLDVFKGSVAGVKGLCVDGLVGGAQFERSEREYFEPVLKALDIFSKHGVLQATRQDVRFDFANPGSYLFVPIGGGRFVLHMNEPSERADFVAGLIELAATEFKDLPDLRYQGNAELHNFALAVVEIYETIPELREVRGAPAPAVFRP